MPRQLENWLTAYGDWTLPRSESPESMIIWAGLFAVSSAVKRHVYFPKRLMGSYSIYPNLYVIYVGPPGVVRKSTTAGYAEQLLHSVNEINLASTAMSASKLVEIMSETLDGSLSILASELGTFMNISKEEMYDLLTDLYDGKVRYDYATRMHGIEIVENPCVNFLAATTPSWVAEQMPVHVIGGGFASRCIFIFEERRRRKQLYYDIDWRHYQDLGTALENDLKHISELEGEFRHENKATRDMIEAWYQATPDEHEDDRIEGYFNRKHVHLHKVAMLLSLCERDDLIITETHFQAAQGLLEGLEEHMPRAFSSVGKNPYSDDIFKVLEFIQEIGGGKPVERKHIARRFFHRLQGAELDEVLSTLTAMEALKYVKSIDNKNVRAYQPTGKGF
jgi:hypothetical protein